MDNNQGCTPKEGGLAEKKILLIAASLCVWSGSIDFFLGESDLPKMS